MRAGFIRPDHKRFGANHAVTGGAIIGCGCDAGSGRPTPPTSVTAGVCFGLCVTHSVCELRVLDRAVVRLSTFWPTSSSLYNRQRNIRRDRKIPFPPLYFLRRLLISFSHLRHPSRVNSQTIASTPIHTRPSSGFKSFPLPRYSLHSPQQTRKSSRHTHHLS